MTVVLCCLSFFGYIHRMQARYRIYALGDQALTIEIGESIDENINAHCHTLAAIFSAAKIPGVVDIVPAYASVSVVFDATLVHRFTQATSAYHFIRQQAEALIRSYDWKASLSVRRVEVPACFDPAFAIDLEESCERLQLDRDALVQRFIAKTYRVYMIGFLPGFAYMGKLDERIALPRKEKPHLRILPGSIGIAGRQTGIYPLASPGGWNIIGRTPVRLFEKDADEPCFFRSGDEVVFKEISIDTFHQLNEHEHHDH